MSNYLIILFLLLAPAQLLGQAFQAELYLQDNAFGLQKGIAAHFQTKKVFSFGLFYQYSDKISVEKRKDNFAFAGINTGVRLKSFRTVSVQFNLKTGLVDNTFFIVTPELQTNCSITPWADLAFTAGYRVGDPAIGLKIVIHPFNKFIK